VALSAGTRLGPYEILAPLGAGGMGEVYRARDKKLDRDVAIKVLPEKLFEEKESIARFEREAKSLAAVNHSHIASLYSFEEASGRHLLVMELVEGQTLAERLLKGPLAPDQLLKTAVEIAFALDAAHRAGIVHRDLKPGNVMLTKSGVKLLDFGLAKAAASPVQQSELTSQPTKLPKNLTQKGTILGTFQYMAPEQLDGKEADPRSDIFAFGAVLYEMATGRKAFEGKSHASLISAVMSSDPPPVSTIQPMTPPALDRVVRTCLAKDPEERWQSAHDVASELEWIAEGSQAGAPAVVVSRRKARERLSWGAATAFALVAAAFAVFFVLGKRGTPVLHPIHALIPIPDGARFQDVALPEISPDGTMIVWSGVDTSFDPGPLWVRTLSGDDARVLAGTERAMYAFWSPDSRSIGFFADRKLKRIDLAGGAPITLCNIPDVGRGGTWNRGGVIVFSGARAGPLFRVPATGGVPEPVTKLDTSRGDTTHRWPHFLPDGRRFLYLASPNVSEKRAVFVATLDGRENRPLALAPDASLSASESGHPARTEAVANAAYASGHLLFVQRGTLYARPFDPSSATITGPAVVVAENVASGFGIIRSMFSASQSGDLVFVTEPTNFDVRVEWIDRGGHRSPALTEALVYSDPQLSPDGRRLAIVIQDAQSRQADIWTIDLAGGARTRLTFGPGSSSLPIWSPDGNSIAYVAGRQKVFGLFEKSSTGTGAEKLLLDMKGDTLGRPTWSPNGQLLLYTIWDPSEGTKHDIWAVPVSPPAKPFPYLRTTADEDEARFSPNGKYVAHTASTESGSNEVYVQTFPAGGGKWQISTHGGATPRWRRDGKELFFLGGDGRIFSAPVRAGPAFEVGTPRPVIESLAQVSDYDVAPDGQRLLICKPVVDPAHLPLRLIAHWPAALER